MSEAQKPVGYIKRPDLLGVEPPVFIRAEDRCEAWQKEVFTVPVYTAPQTSPQWVWVKNEPEASDHDLERLVRACGKDFCEAPVCVEGGLVVYEKWLAIVPDDGGWQFSEHETEAEAQRVLDRHHAPSTKAEGGAQ
ncbi:hypothetical protein SAMN06297251_12752 [Fulvimarina manganoxydans]|uniref:Uncharacterized protein n=1 Tax=Fulvimarina manganoxydans TaxID=937218 RepID=A0A1W2EL35_9HYPH|nr:hypothetical protein [Fulvimarina manganoxydans]SMD10232.1 hypothetical protein SAMN06297251_12752 [Fulvimarina manganoxydans]